MMEEFSDDEARPKPLFSAVELAEFRRNVGDEQMQSFLRHARMRVQLLEKFVDEPSTLPLEKGERALVLLILLAMTGEMKPLLERMVACLPPPESVDEYQWKERLTVLLAQDASRGEFGALLDDIMKPGQ